MPSVITRLLAPCCALLAAACDSSPPEIVLSGPTMGTTYTVKVASAPATKLAALYEEQAAAAAKAK